MREGEVEGDEENEEQRMKRGEDDYRWMFREMEKTEQVWNERGGGGGEYRCGMKEEEEGSTGDMEKTEQVWNERGGGGEYR
ncbi:hypothetical protein Pcinc_035379 [Petrolisthes cinctipes]|uniref:Uncharacterized protein n=1 Tax=Petrolisthes cinctipes TaxID=88211 RepID=A0AAE1END7_PETCI|nr:hypothetical protein Pcinc_035379 [Petrolisthes cinctipes]